ncbi:leucine-rich repeat protein kinase family protein [Tanacetum coccineum]
MWDRNYNPRFEELMSSLVTAMLITVGTPLLDLFPLRFEELVHLERLQVKINSSRLSGLKLEKLKGLIELELTTDNKLVEVHSALSSLQRLEILDLSNNRLTSLVNLELDKMQTLRTLDLKYNKLGSFFAKTSVEMDVAESSTITDLDDDSSNDSIKSPFSYSARKPKKGLKPCIILAREARKQCLNICESSNAVVIPETLRKNSSMDEQDDELDDVNSEQVVSNFELVDSKDIDDNCVENGEHLRKRGAKGNIVSCVSQKIKGPTGRDLDMSFKYSTTSFCSIDDRLPDGFYDASGDRPFLSLDNYEKTLHFGSIGNLVQLRVQFISDNRTGVSRNSERKDIHQFDGFSFEPSAGMLLNGLADDSGH